MRVHGCYWTGNSASEAYGITNSNSRTTLPGISPLKAIMSHHLRPLLSKKCGHQAHAQSPDDDKLKRINTRICGRRPAAEAPDVLDVVAFAVATNPVVLPIDVVFAPVA